MQVIPDRGHVAFMYSYPNLIPLPPATVQRIGATLADLEFGAIYGGWWGAHVRSGAKAAVARSVDRYVAAVNAER